MSTMTALSIIVRHVEDPDEGGRVCHDCGRPWPCDVRRLVDAMAAEAQFVGAGARPSEGPFNRSVHARRAAARVTVA